MNKPKQSKHLHRDEAILERTMEVECRKEIA